MSGPHWRLPSWGTNCNIWRKNASKLSTPAYAFIPSNLCTPHRTAAGPDSTLTTGDDSMYRYLLNPIGTDIRGQFSPTGSDIVEVPAGSGRFYNVIDSDNVATGFANEHVLSWLSPIIPLPGGPVVPTPPSGAYLWDVQDIIPVIAAGTTSSNLTTQLFAGLNVIPVTSFDSTGNAATITSSLAGLITPYFSLPLQVVFPGFKMWVSLFVWPVVVGTPETITLTLGGTGYAIAHSAVARGATGVDLPSLPQQGYSVAYPSPVPTGGVPAVGGEPVLMFLGGTVASYSLTGLTSNLLGYTTFNSLVDPPVTPCSFAGNYCFSYATAGQLLNGIFSGEPNDPLMKLVNTLTAFS